MNQHAHPHEFADTDLDHCPSCGHDHSEQVSLVSLLCVGSAGVLTGLGLIGEWTAVVGEPVSHYLFLAAVAVGIWMFLPGALRAARRLAPDMNLLMALAVFGALGIGESAEAAAVVFLFSLSELLESYASRRSQRALKGLLDISPATALVQEDGQIVERRVEEVSVGANVLVKSGQRIPLDGNVTSGESSVDQALVTGESIPIMKGKGDPVYAGTMSGDGSLDVRVTKVSGDSTLARIVKLVEEAQKQRAPSERFVDQFARYYTPVVALAAVVVAVAPPLLFDGDWSVWFYRSLMLLVIACPCALVISTPVAIVSALTVLARHGVLVKGGAHLEALGRLRAIAVDKTGTITEGKPCLLEIHPRGDCDDNRLLEIAAAIEAHSQHPLARTIVATAQERGLSFTRAGDYRSHNGRGAEGTVDGHRYFVGNHRFTHELGVCSHELENELEKLEAKGRSVVVIGHAPHGDCGGEVLGIFAIGDAVRPEGAAAVQALRDCGVQRVTMLSGDNQRTVSAIAVQAGIKDARGDLLPAEKAAAVQDLMSEFETVAMVGDGINDAPALATASVGIAMGAAGTDIAIETADVALMNDELNSVATAIRMGHRALGIIRFNIAFAVGIKLVILALAVFGIASLWLAIFADTGATLIVIANSLRLLSFRWRLTGFGSAGGT